MSYDQANKISWGNWANFFVGDSMQIFCWCKVTITEINVNWDIALIGNSLSTVLCFHKLFWNFEIKYLFSYFTDIMTIQKTNLIQIPQTKRRVAKINLNKFLIQILFSFPQCGCIVLFTVNTIMHTEIFVSRIIFFKSSINTSFKKTFNIMHFLYILFILF